jgi:hypothetical protein
MELGPIGHSMAFEALRGFGSGGIRRRKYEFTQSSVAEQIQNWHCGENRIQWND